MWGYRSLASMRPLDDLQDLGFRCSETLVEVLEKFLRNGEISEGGMNVAVAEVGGQNMATGSAGLIPCSYRLSHPVDDKAWRRS